MGDNLILEREYDVVAATGLREPMVGELAYDTARDCLWATVKEYKDERPRLLRLALGTGDMTLLELPIERYAGGLTVGRDGTILVGAVDGRRPRVLALDEQGNVAQSVATGRGWPSRLGETKHGDLVMAGGGRRGFGGVCCYSGSGRKQWQAEFPPGVNSVIPIHQAGRTFAVVQSSRISVFELDERGGFIGGRDIGPADIRPSLMVSPGSSSKHLGWCNTLLDAAAGPDGSSLLILYSFPIHFQEFFGPPGAKLFLLYYRWGHKPLAFEPPTRFHRATAVGPNTVAGLRQVVPNNECVLSTFRIDDWNAGTPLDQAAGAVVNK